MEVVNQLFAEHWDVAQACTELIRIKGGQSASMGDDRRQQITELLIQQTPMVAHFDEGAWYALIDHVVVSPGQQMLFVTRDGREINAQPGPPAPCVL